VIEAESLLHQSPIYHPTICAAVAMPKQTSRKRAGGRDNATSTEHGLVDTIRRFYPPVAAIFVVGTLLVDKCFAPSHPLNFATAMLTLPYQVTKTDGTVLYGKGDDDLRVVAFLLATIFCARFLVTECIVAPIGTLLGSVSRKKWASFLDMGWQFCWYTYSFSASAWFVHTETQFDIANIWRGQNGPTVDTNPHLALSWGFKIYYLAELAFWLSMVFTTLLEKRRKDFGEMMAHHCITSAMIYYSYHYNFAARDIFQHSPMPPSLFHFFVICLPALYWRMW
jgi:hypothetical protein